MARFRESQVRATVLNRAGGEAFEQSPRLGLVSLLLTSFVKDKFYESSESQLDRLVAYIDLVSDKSFIMKAAIYARNEFGMRSISHALSAELCAVVKGESWLRAGLTRVVRRPDDMLEILGYWLGQYGKPIPNAMKRGLGDAFNKFDEYQLAKYRGARSSVKLVDALNLCHPRVKPELQGAIAKLVSDELRSRDTWERELSEAGQAVSDIEDAGERAVALAEAKREKWADMVRSRKIGQMALLKNLRNILSSAPEVADDAFALLCDERRVRKSLILPFRYITAYRELEKALPFADVSSVDLVRAMSRAIDVSLTNVPDLPGRTLVALDESGSMSGGPIETGSMFAAVLCKRLGADLLSFSDAARFRAINPDDSTLSLAKGLCDNAVMRGTNFHCIFQHDSPYDRVIILSDMQGWIGYIAPTGTFENYKQRTGCDPHIYSFDLNGYGDMQFPERQVYCLAGFSSNIFDVMGALETDKQALIHTIEAIEL